jgi:hypothetical protein
VALLLLIKKYIYMDKNISGKKKKRERERGAIHFYGKKGSN